MRFFVKQGANGRWRWLIEHGGEVMMLDTVNNAYEKPEGARQDCKRAIGHLLAGLPKKRMFERHETWLRRCVDTLQFEEVPRENTTRDA